MAIKTLAPRLKDTELQKLLSELSIEGVGDIYVYLRIENAEGYVLIAVYLFICMRVTRITKKVLKLNHMKFGGMIGYYPGTI